MATPRTNAGRIKHRFSFELALEVPAAWYGDIVWRSLRQGRMHYNNPPKIGWLKGGKSPLPQSRQAPSVWIRPRRCRGTASRLPVANSLHARFLAGNPFP